MWSQNLAERFAYGLICEVMLHILVFDNDFEAVGNRAFGFDLYALSCIFAQLIEDELLELFYITFVDVDFG